MNNRDSKKEFKEFYSPSSKDISIVRVPSFHFLMIDGSGDPNTSKEYADAVAALYSIAYTLKFMVKKTGINFSVLPLEGLWWVPKMEEFSIERKEKWLWRMMIMQPDSITDKHFKEAVAAVQKKKELPAIDNVSFSAFEEGLAVQILYHGPYSGEASTIARLHEAIRESGHTLTGKHHEIYLNDPRRTAPEKLRTIIRQPMK